MAYAKQNGEPKQVSGKQELYEAIVNMYCWSGRNGIAQVLPLQAFFKKEGCAMKSEWILLTDY